MYYGEVAVAENDLSRFLSVAEQFQVRGLVENVPKVGDARGPRKRPRLEEDEGSGSYQPLGSYQPVGLVCPRCRIICRDGPDGLQAHMAVCGQEDRPVLQVAPSRQRGSLASRARARQVSKPPLARGHPAFRGRGGGRGGGRGRGGAAGGGAGPSRQTSEHIKASQGPVCPPGSLPGPRPGPVPAGATENKPNLKALGQKFGMSVSISLASQKPQPDSGEPEIKQEPPSASGNTNLILTLWLSPTSLFLSGDGEDPGETEDERESGYPGFEEEEETEYENENQFEEAYDGAGDLAAEYLEDGEDMYPDLSGI